MTDKEREFLENELGLKKVKAANLLAASDLSDLDYDGPKTQEEIATAVGVHRDTLRAWRRDRNFIKYKNGIGDDFFAEFRSTVQKSIKKLIDSPQPSVKAIDIYAKWEGIYENKHTFRNEDTTNSGESNEDLAKSLESLKKMKLSQESEGN
jgi:hypothetical protein